MEIARSLPRLRDELAFPAWAYRIVSRRCARYIRNAQTERIAVAEGGTDGVRPVSEAAVEPALHRAIAGLPSDQRAAVALF